MNGYEHYMSKKWISPSAACNFARCKRLYFYRNGCLLKSKMPAPALSFGSCIHKGLPYAFKGDIPKAMKAFCTDWKGELQDDKRNVMRAQAMFENFHSCHQVGKSIYTPLPAPTNRLKVEEHKSEYEVPFAVDIGLDVPLVGIVDCLAQHNDTKKTWAVEFKTTSQLGKCFLQAFNLSPQVLTYALAMKALIGEEVEGVFLEGLLVAKVSCNTMIIPIYIKPHYLEEILTWLRAIYNGIKKCEKEENFPKDFSGCNSYAMFGLPGFTCPFEPLCSTTSDWTSLKDIYDIGEQKETPF